MNGLWHVITGSLSEKCILMTKSDLLLMRCGKSLSINDRVRLQLRFYIFAAGFSKYIFFPGWFKTMRTCTFVRWIYIANAETFDTWNKYSCDRITLHSELKTTKCAPSQHPVTYNPLRSYSLMTLSKCKLNKIP